MKLKPISKPDGPLTPDTEQGQPFTTETGWTVEGFRDQNDRYVERATRRKNEQWYALTD